jgi:hypothetical protein
MQGHMTTSHLILIGILYLAAFVGVAYLTRAKARRIVGALCGGAIFGVIAVLAVAMGENQGWWQVPKAGSSHFRLLLWLSFAVSCAPVYLITWRAGRRFGGRGLAVLAVAAAVIGPARDYQVAAMFPDWIVFSLGIAPILAVAAIYVLLVVVGHAVMRMISGPARSDSFARRPWCRAALNYENHDCWGFCGT